MEPPRKLIIRLRLPSKPKLSQLNSPPVSPSSSSTSDATSVAAVKFQKSWSSRSTSAATTVAAVKFVPRPTTEINNVDHLDDIKAGEQLKLRYQQAALRKQSRQIQILSELPSQPPSSRGIKRTTSTAFPANGNDNHGKKKQGSGSLIMKKARREYANCLEVKNRAFMQRKHSGIAPATAAARAF